ncbi:hypothetical protein TGAM01_v209117 [Trichoderma gamsii]|uniref:Uncharacterized protein n=1 Tax=Trichoderma gamsii TaxID=398673 RepID=A0A2P4ZCM3_9HYPO|nr:hypothetical protein TGAM01_v209117 [Trichoderma gamsii]PON22047.1 hypothetical protein TGAM01_v209117 [Trichoderma gamsii]
MHFKTLFAAALTASSVFAMSSTQQGQIKQNEKSVQSEQIQQLENLAHTIQSQQQQMDGILLVGAPTLNASAITSTLGSISAVFQTTGNAISNITATTLAQQLPAVITAISSLAGNIVTNAGSIITTPVIGVFSLADQQAIFDAFTQLVNSNTALINAFLGPNGLVSNSLLRGPIGVVLNLIERTVVNLAGALIARIPAFAQQAQTLLSQLHGSLALTISF